MSPEVPTAVFFVGDSITFGWRDESLGGWPARLAGGLAGAPHPVTSYNLGVRGDTSDEIMLRWRDEVLRRRRGTHAAIVFSFGVNDAKIEPGGRRTTPLQQVRRNVGEIFDQAVGEHRVLFVGPTPIEEKLMNETLNADGALAMPTNAAIADVSAIIADEARRAGIPFLDLLGLLGSDEAWLGSLIETDGLHPSARGHDLIAQKVAGWPSWSGLFGLSGA